MASFNTLTTTFNHQISKLVIGVKNIYKRWWQIWGKSRGADKQVWLLKGASGIIHLGACLCKRVNNPCIPYPDKPWL